MSRAITYALLLAAMLMMPVARAEHSQGQPSASAPATGLPAPPLPELPELTSAELPAATSEQLHTLDERLERLVRTPVAGPVAQLDLSWLTKTLEPGLVSAIAERLRELKEELDGQRARHWLDKARKRGRHALRKAQERSEHKGSAKADAGEGDWLVFALAAPSSSGASKQHLVRLYGMLRILEAIGSTASARQMVASYSAFGELVRIDLQRSFTRMRDHAVAALIEATRHDARKVRRWARRQLDRLGRAIPGEAVSSSDPAIVADVLRAYGRIRDVDAAPVVLSFVNSDRPELRRAAREAVGAIGKAAKGHYRDSYRNASGKDAPAGWSWRRVARELFRFHDQARLREVYQLYARGQRAYAHGELDAATAAFDEVLAQRPLFAQRHQIAPVYLDHGQSLIDAGKFGDAELSLRKGWRLATKGRVRDKIEARLAYLEGRRLAETGTPDRFVLERAAKLDPDFLLPKSLLESLERQVRERQDDNRRLAASAAIGLLALAVALLLARRLRRNARKGQQPLAPGSA